MGSNPTLSAINLWTGSNLRRKCRGLRTDLPHARRPSRRLRYPSRFLPVRLPFPMRHPDRPRPFHHHFHQSCRPGKSPDFFWDQRTGRLPALSAPVREIKTPGEDGRGKMGDGRKKVRGGGYLGRSRIPVIGNIQQRLGMNGGNHLLSICQKRGGLHRLPEFTREAHRPSFSKRFNFFTSHRLL